MKFIESAILPITEVNVEITSFFKKTFNTSSDLGEQLKNLIKVLRTDLFVYIEYPYVDKVYRNSYYHYFSSKNNDYPRNCVRLSLFDKNIDFGDFYSSEGRIQLKSSFLGFVIIRPTPPCIVGRSVISPTAFKYHDFSICEVSIEVMVNGLKLSAKGFPHSSQDSETITCAETTIWSVMEYFGHRYADWKPALPSIIIESLSAHTFERQLPSGGLTPEQISYVFKEFGFGVKLYSAEQEQDDLKKLLYYYVSSGIPVVVTLQGYDIGHAVVYVGTENPLKENIEYDDITESIDESTQIIDVSNLYENFVVIDDNYSPYQLADFDKPTKYYTDPQFKNLHIDFIIVPLHPKIYLEALHAKKLMMNLFESKLVACEDKQPVIFKMFLTSSRSFKNEIATNQPLDSYVKELIIQMAMPKFIWVAELSNPTLFEKNEAFGLIIVDATETSKSILEALILIACPKKIVTYAHGIFTIKKVDFNSFPQYTNNLKSHTNGSKN